VRLKHPIAWAFGVAVVVTVGLAVFMPFTDTGSALGTLLHRAHLPVYMVRRVADHQRDLLVAGHDEPDEAQRKDPQ
jgi:hypothetical protein